MAFVNRQESRKLHVYLERTFRQSDQSSNIFQAMQGDRVIDSPYL